MKLFQRKAVGLLLALAMVVSCLPLPVAGLAAESVTLTVPASLTISPGEEIDLRGLIPEAQEYLVRQDLTLQFVLQGNATAMGLTLSDMTLTASGDLNLSPAGGSATMEVAIRDGADRFSLSRTTITILQEGGSPSLPTDTEEPEDTTPTQPEVPQEPVTPAVPNPLPQSGFVLQGPSSVTYGETVQLTTSGGQGTGEVTYKLLPLANAGEASLSPTGLLTPIKPGLVRVQAQKAGDSSYLAITADAIDIQVLPASITITGPSLTARVGDPVPTLTGGAQVTGLVGRDQLKTQPVLTFQTTPDMTRPGAVAIQVSGAEVPDGGCYDPAITYVAGKLTIQENPAYTITFLPAENGTLTAYQTTAQGGSRVSLTAQPQEGYVVDAITVQGANGSSATVTETGKDQYAFTMPESDVTVSARFRLEELPPAVLPFADVGAGDWFYENVAYVFDRGLMNGTSSSRFSPNGTTTRGMIVTILYRMAGSPEAPGWSPFSDVPPDQYYAGAVAWAAWNGIVNGKSSTSFAPNDPITREQMATIFYRYGEQQGRDVSGQGNLYQFHDQGTISPYARPALAWACGAGIITGKGQGLLDPQGPATRAQAAAILQRFCETFSL